MATKIDLRNKVLRKLRQISSTQTATQEMSNEVEDALDELQARLESKSLVRREVLIVSDVDAGGVVEVSGDQTNIYPATTGVIAYQDGRVVQDGITVSSATYTETNNTTKIDTTGTFSKGVNEIAQTWTIDTVPDDLVFSYVNMTANILAVRFGVTGARLAEFQFDADQGEREFARVAFAKYQHSTPTRADYF